MRVGEEIKVQNELKQTVEKNEQKENPKISIFAEDGIFDVKEQVELLNDYVNADEEIQSAIKKGFELKKILTEEIQYIKESGDIKLEKDENNSYKTDIEFRIRRSVLSALNFIKSAANSFLRLMETKEVETDEAGNNLREVYKDADGKTYKTIEREYDGEILRKTIERDETGNIKSVSDYDENGVIEHKTVNHGRYFSEHNYDEKGYENQRILKDSDGNILETFNDSKFQNDIRENLFELLLGN